MKIGKLKLETVAPDAGRLVSSTGLSVAEMRGMLAGRVTISLLARALHACVEGVGAVELARHIADHGVDVVKAEVAKLYAEPKKKGGPRGK